MTKRKKESGSKMGRPPKPEKDRRSYLVNVRITESERKRFEKLARNQGKTLSEVLMTPWREGDK